MLRLLVNVGHLEIKPSTDLEYTNIYAKSVSILGGGGIFADFEEPSVI